MFSAQRLAVALSLLTLGYLTLPVLVFLAGWLWWPWALSSTALTVTAFGLLAKRILATPNLTGVYVDALVPWHTLFLSLLPLSALTLISGVGGYGPGNIDWVKHHAVLYDLVSQPWPVTYSLPVGRAALVYNVAYYLPAAVVGKVWGWAAANHALFATTLLGAWLVSLWLAVFCPRHTLLAVGVFTFFSGMDSLGFLLHFPVPHRIDFLLHQTHIDWWTAAWQLPAHLTGIFWSPQHTFAAWLATALLLHVYWRDCHFGVEWFLVALLLFWSPFVAVGALPFAWLVRRMRTAPLPEASPRTRWDRVPAIAAIVLAIVGLLFYAAHYPEIPSNQFGVPQPATTPANGFFFAAKPPNQPSEWSAALQEYVLCAALEFGLLALVLTANRHALVPRERRVLLVSTLFLLGLMLFRYGFYNDLVMRASLPALFALSLLLVLSLPQIRTPASRTFIVLIFAFGMFTPLLSIRGNLESLSRAPSLWRCPQGMHLTLAASQYRRDYPLILSQYLTRTENLFFRVFAKKITP